MNYGPYYAPPGVPPPGYGVPQMPGANGPRPPVWGWYVGYAILMALMYVACAAGGALLAIAADKDEDRIQGVVMLVVGFPLLFLYAAAPLLPKRPWAWTFHLVLIALSGTSACCLPACIPLVIYWLKPETKAFFGKY